jgi:hypothetical protein
VIGDIAAATWRRRRGQFLRDRVREILGAA